MKNRGLECLGWVVIVVVAFWGGRLTAPEKIRVEKVPETERVEYATIYKINEIPIHTIITYLQVQGLEVWSKGEADRVKSEAHSYWQEGYKEGVRKGCR